MIRINKFFTDTLKGELRNPRWSWGAIDKEANRVFLRIWEDQIRPSGTGQKAQIYWKHPRTPSHGYAERLEQVDRIRAGARGLGISTIAVNTNPEGHREIKSYRNDVLFELGEISEDEDGVYAQLGRAISVNQIVATRPVPPSKLPSRKELSSYEKAMLEGTVGRLTRGVRIRCQKLRDIARQYYRDTDGKLRCRVCGWYKPSNKIAGDIVEIHHLKPIASLPPEGVQQFVEYALKTLVPLCPCCHRISHCRKGNIRHLFSVAELTAMVPMKRKK